MNKKLALALLWALLLVLLAGAAVWLLGDVNALALLKRLHGR